MYPGDDSLRQAERLRALEVAQTCVSCGSCQSVCPVYRAGRREELVARGKLKLVGRLDRGDPIQERELAQALGRCLGCGRCTANCPNQVLAAEGLQAARASLDREAIPLAKRLAMDQALKHPRRLDAAMRAGRLAWPLTTGLGLRLPGLAGAERLPRPAGRFYLEDAPREIPGPAGAPRVALFVGCVANYLRPGLAAKAAEILSRRYTVVIPPDQGCCGLPAIAGGLTEPASALGRRNLAALAAARVDRVVTACASCAYALQKDLPLLVDEARRPAAEDLAAKVVEISRILAENPAMVAGRARPGTPVALHTPCHLGVGLKAGEEPAAYLAAAGAELAPMAGGDQCCGGGGLFAVQEPELSRRVFAPRAQALADSGAQVLATSCSGCFIQWLRGLDPAIPVIHPIELLDQA